MEHDEDTTTDWLPLEAFMAQERLTPSDLVRLIQDGIPPRLQTINTRVWVHTPTLYDWRMLVEVTGFKTSAVAHG